MSFYYLGEAMNVVHSRWPYEKKSNTTIIDLRYS